MCGVVGIIHLKCSSKPVYEPAREAFLGLTTLQHRGQDAAGIFTYDTDGFHRVKNIGLVDSVFNRDNMLTLTGSMAVGHTRYSTIGRGDLVDVQPFVMSYPYGLAMVHNGNIVNCHTLGEKLRTQSHRQLLTHSDSEIILNLFAEALADQSKGQKLSFEHICRAVNHIHENVQGSYSVVLLIADFGMVAFRDKKGIRPLVWGQKMALIFLLPKAWR